MVGKEKGKMEHWNQKVAANRGESWRSALLTGRLEASMNPTKIRLERIKQKKSQTDIAKKLGLTYATYGAIEGGRRQVREERAKEIAELLGLKFKSAFATMEDGKFIARKEASNTSGRGGRNGD